MARRLLALALAVLAFAAFAAVADAPAPDAAGPCAGAARSGRFSLALQSGDIKRYALVNVPPKVRPGRPLPLVLVLHGAGGNGRDMEKYTGMSGTADRYGFVAVYPSSVPKFWNISASPNKADDVAFMRTLLDTVESQVCIDPARVYATGVSNGGGMVALLGCAMSDRITAIAPVAGNYLPLPACAPGRPVSMLEIHGTSDRSVPYRIVPGWVGTWLRLDGCSLNMRTSRPAPGEMRYDAGPCTAGTRVSHLELFGGEHEWPPPANGAVWSFFSRLRLPPAAATAARARARPPSG